MIMPSCGTAELLVRARPGMHACQLHDTPDSLCEMIARFARPGLEQEDAVVVVAVPEHREAVAARLRLACVDVDAARASGQLIELDAVATLRAIMRDGRPDPDLLRSTLIPLLERAALRKRGCVRIYGEMVSLLWQSARLEAAIALEECWNELARTQRFALLCGYLVDGLDARGYDTPLHEIGRTHTDVLTSDQDERLRAAVDAATHDVLGISFSLVPSCSGREQRVGEHRLPSGRRTLLWLHRNMPVTSHHILERARTYMRGDAPRG